ncbi:MAG: hypothetical protein IKN87_02995 [Bacilli bacterium]|nr:hypothetical protein [Bacilli bacterium]
MKKKLFVGLFAFVLCILVVGCGSKASKNENKKKTKEEEKIKIVKAETSKIKYEEFDNGLIKLQIPKGWKVYIPKVVTYSGYSFRVYNPENPDIGYMFSLCTSGFPKSEADRAYFYSLYPAAIFGQLSAVDPHTTEGYYNAWAHNAKLANESQLGEDFFIVTTDWEMVENLGKGPFGGDILRGTYLNSNGEKMQGLFTATVVESGIDILLGLNIEPLKSYHNIILHAPDADFNEWVSILDYSISTLEFSDAFISGFLKEEASEVAAVKANAKIYDEISDMIMDSWNKRSNSYDIISQKQSDATLGYERVYDVETGDVYRAYNGFTDGYNGSKYQTVTDDMYTLTISGYIEK